MDTNKHEYGKGLLTEEALRDSRPQLKHSEPRQRMFPHNISILLVLALTSFQFVRAQDDEDESGKIDKVEASSPDGRYAFHRKEDRESARENVRPDREKIR